MGAEASISVSKTWWANMRLCSSPKPEPSGTRAQKKDRAPEILLAQDSEIQQLMAHFQGQIPHGQQSDLP
jgi:hypothetical protein